MARVVLRIIGPALLLAAIPSVLAGVNVQAEFAEPAWGSGIVSGSSLEWAYLVFHDPKDASFNVRADPDSSATNNTVLYGKRQDPVIAEGAQPVNLPPSTTDLSRGFSGTLGFTTYAWSSLYIEADRIFLEQRNAESRLGMVLQGESLKDQFPPVALPSEYQYRHLAAIDPAIQFSTRSGSPRPEFFVTLQATGLHRVEWLNATIDCAEGPCPDAGAPSRRSADAFGPTQLQRLTFVDVHSPGGRLDGSAQIVASVVGGKAPSMEIQGGLRLPDARLVGQCPQGPCPDPAGQTFLADGRMSLAEIRAASEPTERLQATLSGEFTSAAFDEQEVASFGGGAALAAGAVAVSLGLILFWKALVGLFARSARPPALQHPKRRQLYALVRDHPGLSFRELQRRLGWSVGTLQHHVKRLLEARMVVAEPYRNTTRYFENHGRYRDGWKSVLQLSDSDSRQLYDWISANPAQHQNAIVAETAAWGWTRAKTLRRLSSLTEAGLLAIERNGRKAKYRSVQPPP